MCMGCYCIVPQTSDLRSTLGVYLDDHDQVDSDLYPNDRPQSNPLLEIARSDDVEEQRCERHPSPHASDDGENFDKSNSVEQSDLLLRDRQRCEMSP